MESMDIDLTSKEMFLIDTAIHLYSGADRESYEMRTSDEVYEIMSNKYELLSIENVDDILESYDLISHDLDCNNYGIYDKQLNQFKENWNGFNNKNDLKNTFEEYMKEVLLPVSAIELAEIDSNEVLWELFEYDIRPFEN